VLLIRRAGHDEKGQEREQQKHESTLSRARCGHVCVMVVRGKKRRLGHMQDGLHALWKQ